MDGLARGGPAPHAVVVGAGFGGLAAAIRLGARGYRVTLVDRLDRVGGRAYTYEQDGFVFDAGPTIITVPHLLHELWGLCGRNLSDDLDMRALEPCFRIRFDDGDSFHFYSDMDTLRAEVKRISPGDVAGFERFMAYSRQTYEIGYDQMGDMAFHRLSTMIKAIPSLVKAGGRRSVYGAVSRYFKSEKLRKAFSFHPLLIGGDPFSVTAIYNLVAYLECEFGVHYAMGGMGALAKALQSLHEGQGGTTLLQTTVAEITQDQGRATGVRLESGEHIKADIVVSNADLHFTYTKLVRGKRRRWSRSRLERAHYSMGVFLWYFGTDKQWPDCPHHSIILGPRYKSLLRDIFWRGKLAPDCSLYLYRPTATDPSMAPEGCDGFYVLSPVPNLKSGINWHDEAEDYRRTLQARLEETMLPGLGQHVISSRILTPLDFQDRYLSYLGAGFSLAPTIFQSAWFRAHNKSEELDGLYLVGAGTHPGAGLPGVISSAKILDEVVPDAHSFA